MRRVFVVATVGIVAVIAAVVGCGNSRDVGLKCADITVPGIAISVPGIQLAIRNRTGQAIALGTDVSASGTSTFTFPGFPDSLESSIYAFAGTYTVRVSKHFYRDTTLSNIVVVAGDCGKVQTTKAAVVLQTVPGAPPVRSITVFGTQFLPMPGNQARAVAIVDADSGVSTAVTFRLSDTTMARVDPSGLVTAKCSVRGGVDTLTVTSVADPTLHGLALFGIGVSASC
jgi:hypothetical protein